MGTQQIDISAVPGLSVMRDQAGSLVRHRQHRLLPGTKQRNSDEADAVIRALGKIKIANPVAEAVAALIRAHCETMRNSFRR